MTTHDEAAAHHAYGTCKISFEELCFQLGCDSSTDEGRQEARAKHDEWWQSARRERYGRKR